MIDFGFNLSLVAGIVIMQRLDRDKLNCKTGRRNGEPNNKRIVSSIVFWLFW
jgi:hypothetical protein